MLRNCASEAKAESYQGEEVVGVCIQTQAVSKYPPPKKAIERRVPPQKLTISRLRILNGGERGLFPPSDRPFGVC